MRDETRARVEHWADSTFDKVGIWLYIVTRGRLSRVLARRRTLLLRTRGRRTGRPRTVVLQYFPDGDDMLVVGANAGLPRNPDWYYNLRADPNPSVLIEGRSLQVSVHECPAERREAFWSLVLSHAPDYEKYMRRTTRQIPFLRLTPQHLPGEAAEKKVVMSTQTMIEVHLEEFGEHSWVKALVNTLSGSYGSAQYRFVARPSGEGHHPSDHVVTGATFPVMRLQDLGDLHRPNAWIETAQERLEELDDNLCAQGWRRCAADGQHWWSRTYVTG